MVNMGSDAYFGRTWAWMGQRRERYRNEGPKERSLYLDDETGLESDMLTNGNGRGSRLC